jgi:hypothetical protein
MAQRSIAWTTNGTGDGTSGGYSAANWVQMTRQMFITNPAAEGVLYGVGNNLAATGTSSPVAVNTGSALVYGIWYENDASENVTIPTPASATRIDRIVLRASWSAQTVRITRIAGTEGSGSAPAMTQTANTTWDIPLANVSITTGGVCTVSDQRTYVKHPGVYGWLNQANTWVGNQTITGTLIATQHQTDSSNYWTLSGGVNPVFVWDGVNDYTIYNRAANTLADVIGGASVRVSNASGDMTITGSFSAGGINASQLSTGTVPLARLSGITTTQLSASAGITGGQIASATVANANLASDINASKIAAGRLAEARMPYQYGSGTTNGSGVQTVTFGTAFLSTPVIFCQSKSFAANVINPTSVSTTGFTANAAIWNGSAFAAGAMDYNWVAIGPM